MIEKVLLLSGGVDSTALAFSLEPDLAVTVNYGQVCAEAEVQAASQVCDQLNLPHRVIGIDCSELGAGSLAEEEQLGISSTPEWWPYRNQMIVTFVAMHAVKLDADKLIVGSVKTDDQHRDGQKEFYEKLDDLLSFQEGNLSVSVPAIDQTSIELVEDSNTPMSLLGWTHSCHESNMACGQCRGCMKRHRILDTVFD